MKIGYGWFGWWKKLEIWLGPTQHSSDRPTYHQTKRYNQPITHLDALFDAQHVKVQQHHDADFGGGVEHPVEKLALCDVEGYGSR